MRPVRIAIFASGRGSNAMALIKKAQMLGPEKVSVRFVMSDKATAQVLESARFHGVETKLIEKSADRFGHEKEILKALAENQVDWILLAGYMRLLSADFIRQFSLLHAGKSQIVNIHPSLLPAYPGKDSIAKAFHDRVSQSGVTIHFVDEGMDTGEVIMQRAITLNESENLENWAQKIHQIEHEMYTEFLENLATQVMPTYFFEENN